MSAPLAISDLADQRDHPIEHFMHVGHDIVAVEDYCRVPRRAKRHVEHRTSFSGVDLLSAEHRLDAVAQPALVGQSQEETDRVVGDAILRIVEVQAGAFGHQALAARGIVSEQ
jgi:hypothetical protein